MNTDIKIRRKLLAGVLAFALATGLGLAISSNITPSTAGGHDFSLAHANMSASARMHQSETTPDDEAEPEDTIGPAIALGVLGVGAPFGAFIIYRHHKGDADFPSGHYPRLTKFCIFLRILQSKCRILPIGEGIQPKGACR